MPHRVRSGRPAGGAGAASLVKMPWVGVPLVGSGQVLGVLCAFDRQGEPFDAGQIEVLETLAAHASTALENIRMRADEVAQRADLEARAAAAQESEQRYRRMVDLSPDAIIVHVEGSVVYANFAAGHLFGAGGPEHLHRLRVLDLVHADSRQSVVQRVRELQSAGAHVPPAEERLLRFDGAPIEAEISAAAWCTRGNGRSRSSLGTSPNANGRVSCSNTRRHTMGSLASPIAACLASACNTR